MGFSAFKYQQKYKKVSYNIAPPDQPEKYSDNHPSAY